MVINHLWCLQVRLNIQFHPFKTRKMSERQILNTIEDYAKTASLAKMAGYDGVEIMGSEGYLLNQFLSRHESA